MEGTPQAVDKLSNKHMAIMDFMVGNPELSQKEVARVFELTESWLSTVVNTELFQDQFQRRIRERSANAQAYVQLKLTHVAEVGLNRLLEKVEDSSAPGFIQDTTIKVLERMGLIQHLEN